MPEPEDEEPLPPCDACGGPTVLARRIPKVGPLPELRTYRCEQCGEVSTMAAPET